ncbi:MAG: hypothetical protein ACYDBQ_00825 [Thermoplasmatota archaeon]
MKARRPGKVALYTFVTLGLYAAWFYFIAFRELDVKAGRRHSALLFLGLVPIVGPFFVLAYVLQELDNLQFDRKRAGLGPSLSGLDHTWRYLVALVPAVVASGFLVAADAPPAAWMGPLALAGWAPVAVAPRVAGDLRELAAMP